MGDSLKFALGRARLTGSRKTQYNHKMVGRMFVNVLRSEGCTVQKWSNVTNKHIGIFVEAMRDRGRTVGTLKTYLSSIRVICKAFGNESIHPKNKKFGIGRREYITNDDRSLPEEIYQQVYKELSTSLDPMLRRVAAHLRTMRDIGTRNEETWKLRKVHIQPDGRLYICDGTKNGRPRLTPDPLTKEQLDTLNHLFSFANETTGTTIPDGMSEAKWADKFEYVARKAGVTRRACGATPYGLRHRFLQKKYEELTGWPARVRFTSYSDFVAAAQAVAGDNWREKDEWARSICLVLAGHGTCRDDVLGNYIGSRNR